MRDSIRSYVGCGSHSRHSRDPGVSGSPRERSYRSGTGCRRPLAPRPAIRAAMPRHRGSVNRESDVRPR